MNESDLTVHIGSMQISDKDGYPELHFASREFDRPVILEMGGFLAGELSHSIGLPGLVMMYVLSINNLSRLANNILE
jgi:hypothetical protein